MDNKFLHEVWVGRIITATFVTGLLLPIFLLILFDLYDNLGPFLSVALLVTYWILFVYVWMCIFRYYNKKIMKEKQEMKEATDRFYREYFRKRKE